MKYFKDRALLTGAQAALDALISAILLCLQLGAIVALLLFVYMGGRLVLESSRTFQVPSAEMAERHKLIVKSAEQAGEKTAEATAQPELDPIAEGENSKVGEALHIAFQGFEFLLFAPLSFLLLRSLTQYIIDLTMKECLHTGSGVKAPAEAALLRDVGKQALFDTKALSIGLLFAIVATHMVGRFLAGKYGQSTIDWKEIVVGGSLLVILSASYLCMERLTHIRHQP
jgi:hypothetical protein